MLRDTIVELDHAGPDWLSVTYGASGATRGRTITATRFIKTQTEAQTVGHLTCASQSRDQLLETLASYAEADVKHILAIRGDMPGGPTVPWVRHPDGLANATELVRLIADNFSFGIGVAAFPDAHPGAARPRPGRPAAAGQAGGRRGFAVTQLFFDADAYFRMVERVRAIGRTLPIVASINCGDQPGRSAGSPHCRAPSLPRPGGAPAARGRRRPSRRPAGGGGGRHRTKRGTPPRRGARPAVLHPQPVAKTRRQRFSPISAGLGLDRRTPAAVSDG